MNEKIQKMIDSRQKYNLKLLKEIEKQVNNNPELRFGQILANLGILILQELKPSQNDYNK